MLRNYLFFLLSAIACVFTYNITNAQQAGFDWAKYLEGSGYESPLASGTDQQGNMIIGGYYTGNMDLDPGPASYLVTNSGGYDAFIAKYDAQGDFLWGTSFSASGYQYVTDLVIDSDGSIIFSLDFENSIDADPGTGTQMFTSDGATDVLLIKLDTGGALTWAKQIRGPAGVNSTALELDNDGNICFGGSFFQRVDMDPGQDSLILALSPGAYRGLCFAKYTAQGSLKWGQHIEVGNYEYVEAFIVFPDNGLGIAGQFAGTIDFDPSAAVSNLTSNGYLDAYFCRLDSLGNLVWAKSIGASQEDGVRTMTYTPSGNIFLTGVFNGSVDFDPGPQTHTITSMGGLDVFAALYDLNGNFISVAQMSSSSSVTTSDHVMDGAGNFYVLGRFSDSVDVDPGTGTHMLYCPGPVACFVAKYDMLGAFQWGASITGSGDITFNGISLSPDNAVQITGYFTSTVDFNPFGGGNSMTAQANSDVFFLQLNQCISSAAISLSECAPYLSPSGNHTWTASGIYQDTIINAAGCDSILTINLTIKPVDTAVTRHWGEFIANADPATYQWLDCDNGYAIIPGETGKKFTPSVNGSYAVEVTEGGCTDTSSCHTITNVGIGEAAQAGIRIYPNPGKEQVHVEFTRPGQAQMLEVCDLRGIQIMQYSQPESGMSIDTHGLAPGMYMIRISGPEGQTIRKWIRE